MPAAIGEVSRMWMRKPLTLITATILLVTVLLVPVSLAQNATPSASKLNSSAVPVGSPIAPPEPAVQQGTPMGSGDVIVKFKQGISTASDAASAIHAKVGATVVQTSPWMPGVQLVKLPAGASVDDAIAQYQSNPAVEGAWPNLTYTLDTTPNDPYYASLESGLSAPNQPHTLANTLATTPNDPSYVNEWGLKNTGQTINGVAGTPGADINAPVAWDTTTGSSSVIVAVADTGVGPNHPDLKANVGPGWNFITNTADTTPLNTEESWHGTHVAGTIGAVTNNALGVAGVDWHVTIMPLQVFNANDLASTYNQAQAIAYAGQHGASIINLSIGGSGYDAFLYQTIQQSPLLVVVSAGNAGTNNDQTPTYPASYDLPNIISVAASDSNDNLASFTHGASNYGATSVDLAAPGSYIYSTYYRYDYGYGYMYAEGTSMAAPHVAGVAALVKAVHPEYGYSQLKSVILSTTDAKPAFAGKMTTGGRLDASKAVSGSAHGWDSLSGYLTSSPAAVSWGTGRIDVFSRGTDGAPLHDYYQNGWSGWTSLDGQLAPGTGPAVSSWAAGRLDLFVAGTDNQLWHRMV